MIFTDEDGNKYEPTGNSTTGYASDIVIRPLPVKKQWEVELIEGVVNDYPIHIQLPGLHIKEAEAIKDWVDAGLEYIFGRTDLHNDYINKMDAARKLLGENTE